MTPGVRIRYHADMIERIDTPILFCNFNRPALTRQVFESIRQRRPTKLFLACDGPRPGHREDLEKVGQVRGVLAEVDWDCDVQHRFLDSNAGCKSAMSAAISWAFEDADRLIILEDDCLPDSTFYDFCGQLLEKYQDNRRVMSIGGNNFQAEPRSDASYYFSRWPHIWGWATWRQSWQQYDVEMASWSRESSQRILNSIFDDPVAVRHWQDTFASQHAGQIDTWDFPWTYSIWESDGICILPERNLVTNIGFGAEATHTTDPESWLASMKAWPVETLVHPGCVKIDTGADLYSWEHVFLPSVARDEQIDKGMRRGLLRKIRDRLSPRRRRLRLQQRSAL